MKDNMEMLQSRIDWLREQIFNFEPQVIEAEQELEDYYRRLEQAENAYLTLAEAVADAEANNEGC